LMTDKLIEAARKAQAERPDFDEDDPEIETDYDDTSGDQDAEDQPNNGGN
jgi:hypothetical protein